MPLSRLHVANLRSFRDPSRLDLRPVTLVYGPNNVGKSALVRALPLLADSIRGERDALDFQARLDDADLSFERLRWRGDRSETGEDLSLGLEFDDGSGVDWSIREPIDWKRLVVSRIELREPGRSVTAEWRLTRGEERDPELTYSAGGGVGRYRFDGLLPPAALFGPDWEATRRRVEAIRDGVIWLGSVRPPPRRRTSWRGGARWELLPDGSDAPIVLAEESEVRADVERWYRDALGLTLDVREVAQRDVLVEVRRASGGPSVDMLDCGEGPGQVLAVVTALAMARHHATRRGPSVICVEEPESHLHPDAQAKLAEFVCESARVPGVRVVFETHSPYLLYAVHLEVMKGFPEDDVALHWVAQDEDGASRVEACSMRADGSYGGLWPSDAFSTEYALLAEMERRRQGQP